METFHTGSKLFFQFKKLQHNGIFHFTSSKQGWRDNGKSRFTGDSSDVYSGFRNELAEAIKVKSQQLIFPRQVHGDKILIVESPLETADIPETDALITNQPELCICVQTADCVPILLFDPIQKVVAAVHAGWRGTVNKIAAKTIHTMQRHFDSEPENIIAGIGPSIHLHAYEVGEEVIVPVRESFENHRSLLMPASNEKKAYLDLWEANKTILLDAGLDENQIEIMGFCSYSHDSLFYSARRDGTDTGRMATGIMILSHK